MRRWGLFIGGMEEDDMGREKGITQGDAKTGLPCKTVTRQVGYKWVYLNAEGHYVSCVMHGTAEEGTHRLEVRYKRRQWAKPNAHMSPLCVFEFRDVAMNFKEENAHHYESGRWHLFRCMYEAADPNYIPPLNGGYFYLQLVKHTILANRVKILEEVKL